MAETDFKPPYMPFATFWNFIIDLSAHPLPPQVDRSLMNSKSGTDQANLLGAFKTFELIDENNQATGLTSLADPDPQRRKEELASLLRRYYADALEISAANGTQDQLIACFRDRYGVTGADTLRKSATFLLHAAREAEIKLSPHFKATRAGSGGPGKAKTPRKPRARKPADEKQDEESAMQNGHQTAYELSVDLAGGTMTLTVTVNPLNLRGSDREFFYGVVDKLTDYQEKADASSHRESEVEFE